VGDASRVEFAEGALVLLEHRPTFGPLGLGLVAGGLDQLVGEPAGLSARALGDAARLGVGLVEYLSRLRVGLGQYRLGLALRLNHLSYDFFHRCCLDLCALLLGA